MRYYKIIALIVFISIGIIACKKHEPLPDLEQSQINPADIPAYNGYAMVFLDSFRIKPNTTSTNFILSIYAGINQAKLTQLGLSYTKIRVFENGNTLGNLNKPSKTFSKLVNSGQTFKYKFTMVDSVGKSSVASPEYTIYVP